MSSGFAELGGEGTAIQVRVLGIARAQGIRILGPNGIGVMSLKQGLVLPFSRMRSPLLPGRVALVCQSGGMGISYFTRLMGEGIGLSRFASIGNKLDVDENDLLEFLQEDEATDAIVLYLEGITDGGRLLRIARGASKPILLHKANIGSMARAIASSHTASLAGDDEVVSAACKQAGILRFTDAVELCDLLKVLALPRAKGRRLAVLSRSGGHAVVTADACEAHGFTLAPFPADFEERVRAHARAGVIRMSNPLDLGDVFDFDIYADLVRDLVARDEVDGLVFLHTYVPEEEGQVSRRMIRRIAALGRRAGKPILVGVATRPAELARLKTRLKSPLFTEAHRAIAALDRVLSHREGVEPVWPSPEPGQADRIEVEDLLRTCTLEGRQPTHAESLEIVACYRVRSPDWQLARTVEEATTLAGWMTGPFALKVVAAHISHKSDVGGVRLSVSNDDVPAAAADLLAMAGAGGAVVIQAMAGPGVDLILGGRRDPVFGPVLLVGMGGIYVEVFRQAVVRVLPLSRAEVRAMIRSLRGSALLLGARGQAPLQEESAVDAVMALQRLLLDHPVIQEIDVNPLRVTKEGAEALDARIVIEVAPIT